MTRPDGARGPDRVRARVASREPESISALEEHSSAPLQCPLPRPAALESARRALSNAPSLGNGHCSRAELGSSEIASLALVSTSLGPAAERFARNPPARSPGPDSSAGHSVGRPLVPTDRQPLGCHLAFSWKRRTTANGPSRPSAVGIRSNAAGSGAMASCRLKLQGGVFRQRAAPRIDGAVHRRPRGCTVGPFLLFEDPSSLRSK